MSNSQVYTPETNEHHPDFPFVLLASVPAEWELYDIPDKTHLRNRALDLATFKKLVRHHTWGFDVTIGERKTKERLLHVLKRLVYNQEPHLRPTWHEFVSRNCDAGPRLLKRSYNALQISRQYPDGIPGQPLRLQPGASGGGVQQQQQQQQQLLHPYQNAYVDGSGIAGGGGGGSLTNLPVIPAAPANFATPSSGMVPLANSSRYAVGAVSGQALHPHFTGNGFAGDYARFVPPELNNTILQQPVSGQGLLQNRQQCQLFPSVSQTASPATSSTPTPMSMSMSIQSDQQQSPTPVPPQSSNLASEHVRQAMVRPPSRQLQRHPEGHGPATTTTTTTTTSMPSLSLSAITHIPLSITAKIPRLTYYAKGNLYPWRGRGPVSRGVSDVFECIIAVGLLLNMESMIADRQNDPNWATRLPPLEKVYLRSLTINWISLSEEESVRRAQEFRSICYGHLNTMPSNNGNQSFLSHTSANVWRNCTSSFGQFLLRYSEVFRPCPCQGPAQPLKRTLSTSIFTTEARDNRTSGNVDLDSSISRFFQYERPIACSQCGTTNHATLQRQFDTLPWRLVIRPDPRVVFLSHSSKEFTVGYMDSQSAFQKSTYRWLGGIYPVALDHQTVYKVFWDDGSYDEGDTGALRIYDAAQVSGVIIGGVHLAQTCGECVPASWWARGSTPLLFYEKVASPPFEVLATSSCDATGLGSDNANHGTGNLSAQSSGLQPERVAFQSGLNIQNQGTQTPYGTSMPNRLTHTIPSSQPNLGGLQEQQQSHGPPFEDLNLLQWDAGEWSSSPLRDADIDYAPDYTYSSSPHGRESTHLGTPLNFPDLSPSQLDPIITTTENQELLQPPAGNGTGFQDGYSTLLPSGSPSGNTTAFPDSLLPPLGNSVCTTTNTGEHTNLTAPPSSPPFELPSVGGNDIPTPSSLLNQTQAPETTLTVEPGIPTESGTVHDSTERQGIGGSNDNAAAASSDLNWAFDIDAAADIDFGAFDEPLGYSVENMIPEQHAQQIPPPPPQQQQQQRSETQLTSWAHSVPALDPGFTPVPADSVRHAGAFPPNGGVPGPCLSNQQQQNPAPKRVADGGHGDGSAQAARKRFKR